MKVKASYMLPCEGAVADLHSLVDAKILPGLSCIDISCRGVLSFMLSFIPSFALLGILLLEKLLNF